MNSMVGSLENADFSNSHCICVMLVYIHTKLWFYCVLFLSLMIFSIPLKMLGNVRHFKNSGHKFCNTATFYIQTSLSSSSNLLELK